jgi:peptidyl-prolyl cis-trans isomerase SurA
MTKFLNPFLKMQAPRADASTSMILRKFSYALVLASLSTVMLPKPAAAQGIKLAPTPALSSRNVANTGAANAPAGVVQADFIVAIVNSEPITNNEVKTRMIRYERRLAEQGAVMPSRADLSREILEDIIREKLQLKLARESGIRVDERSVEAALQNFAKQNNISMSDLRNRSSVDGIGFVQIRTDVQNQLLIQKLRERDVLSAINVSDTDIDNFIKEQLRSEQVVELNIDLAQILIAIPEGSNAAKVQSSLERATRIITRARAGEDFYKLAVENSDAKDASTGGQMGLKSAERYPTLFSEATKDLQVGGLAGPVRSGAGFHVLKVLAKQVPSNSYFAITQTNARHILLRTNATLSEDAAKTKLSALKKRIESGSVSFAAAAKEVSQDGSAASGGELGWANPGQFVPEFEGPMGQLAIGKVSEPVVTRFGVHLLVVQERRKAQLSDTEQREIARNALREKKFDDAYANWISELRGNAYVEYREPQ